jgi:hypothetical protein
MTKLTDPTQAFNRPTFQPQGPDDRCTINGKALGWSSCTSYAFAMAQDATTGGKQRPSGCAVRRATGDTTGGTTLRQNADALMKLYGVSVATYTGANVISPVTLATFIRSGRRVVVQINADAMLGTKFQSTAGAVNHAIMLNEVRGGTVSHPSECLVYDSAADGRKRSYHVDQGPSWWPWSLVLKACANLRPNGPGTARLGPGKVYAGVFADSEPHVRLVPGAVRAKPFPDRARADEPTVAIHFNRTKGGASTIYTVKEGALLTIWQYAEGPEHEGSTRWGGNDNGHEWVHLANLRQVGGTT